MTDSEEPTSDDVQTSVPDLTPLTHPAEGVPVVVTDQAGLEAAIDAIAAGTGPIAIDAERAGGYRYSHNAYLVQLRRTGSGSLSAGKTIR